MWVPYQSGDANMRFRFLLDLEEGGADVGAGLAAA
jgi:hypothetical protein